MKSRLDFTDRAEYISKFFPLAVFADTGAAGRAKGKKDRTPAKQGARFHFAGDRQTNEGRTKK